MKLLLILWFSSGLFSVISIFIYKCYINKKLCKINRDELIELLIILFGGVGSFLILCLIASENLESKNRNMKNKINDTKKYRGY